MAIELVKIRATIIIGDLSVSTPYIQSFNVRKSRGQLSTFDASLKVRYEEVNNNIGGDVVIYAGGNGSENKIFTGILKKATTSPCWDDPGFVIINVSGTDVLSKLQGKKYTRRCRSTNSAWVSINSVNRKGLRDGAFSKETNTLLVDGGEAFSSKEKTSSSKPSTAEQTPKSSTTVAMELNIYKADGYDA